MKKTMAGLRVAMGVLACAWVIAIAAVGSAHAAEPDLARAEELLRQGKAAEAYELLERFEFEQSGNVRYDNLLGIAALESGKPAKATLAFERVLAVNPNLAGARLDMARAYFMLGDMARAKLELERLKSQNPPPAARITIEQYLRAIAEREEAIRTLLTAYLEAGIGYDSNVNNSTGQTQVSVPGLGNLIFNLDPSNVETSDDFWNLAAGLDVTHQLTPRWAITGGLDLRWRTHFDADRFDSGSADGRVGLLWGAGRDNLRFNLLLGEFQLDNTRNRETTGLTAEWRRLVDDLNQFSLYGQYTEYRFPNPSISVNDFDQSTLGVAWVRSIKQGEGAFIGSLYVGKENDTAPGGRADGNKDYYGFRIGGQLPIVPKVQGFWALGAQFGDYDKQNVSFATTREDKQYDFVLGVSWRFLDRWSLRPQFTYTKNDSNIVIYEYDRQEYFLALRRDFP